MEDLMAEKKAKLPRFTTPKGIAKYPWLSRPDTQFNADGVYKVNLLIPADEARELCAALDSAADEAVVLARAAAKSPAIAKTIKRAEPYGPALDDQGEDTGNIEFKFKMNAKVTFKDGTIKPMKPFIYDAKQKQLLVCPNVYGGSVLKVNFSPAPYYAAVSKTAGVSLRINAVQIVELVTGGGGSASGFGFAEEADGFDGATIETPAGAAGAEGSTDF
jgi:hypothetical protein